MITELLNSVASGARKNKYRVLLPVDGSLGKEMDILIHTTTLPGRTLTPVETVIKGHKVQLAGETSLESTWEATFYNTESLDARNHFIKWMTQVHNNDVDTSMPASGVLGDIEGFVNDASAAVETTTALINDPLGTLFGGGGGSASYQKDITIQQLNYAGEKVAEVKLIGAFPTSVSALDYDDSTGEISTTSVIFNYTNIEVAGISEEPGGIKGLINTAKSFI